MFPDQPEHRSTDNEVQSDPILDHQASRHAVANGDRTSDRDQDQAGTISEGPTQGLEHNDIIRTTDQMNVTYDHGNDRGTDIEYDDTGPLDRTSR